ncbi:MAG TPA: VWA domain-containing protein [Bryobacteraceae bacterium]|nr:VWA domain-containing protein [Bryobacteraceae bacterium]
MLLRAQAPPDVRIRAGAWFPPSLVISTNANLVELVATVRDRQGRLTGGLQAADFEVQDNNQPREITFFSERKSQPAGGAAPSAVSKPPAAAPPQTPLTSRSIALFFDDAHASVLGVRMSARAAERLVTNILPPVDQVGIFTASGAVSADFTTDRKLLLAAIARLQPHPPKGVHATTICPTLGPSEAYIIARHLDPAIEETAIGEAVACNCVEPPEAGCIFDQRGVVESAAQSVWQQYEYQSTGTLDVLNRLVRHLAAAPAQRILVLFSPGFPTGGMEERTSAITDAALRAGITISAVNSEGLVTSRTEARKLFLLAGFMAAAAKSTGGQYLHDANDWAGSLRAVVAPPEVSYELGFSPPGNPDGKYHQLKTRIRGNRGYRVESRPGYYAAAAAGQRETAQQHLDRVAMSGAEIKDFPATMQLRQDAPNGRQATLHVTVAVPAAGLRFPEKGGRRVQELTFLTVLQDAQGNFVAGKQSVMDFVLTPARLAEVQKKGIRASISLSVARPASYRVREVIREMVNDHIWASAGLVEIR